MKELLEGVPSTEGLKNIGRDMSSIRKSFKAFALRRGLSYANPWRSNATDRRKKAG